MTIEKLQQVQLEKVQPEALREMLEDMLSDYDKTNDKEAFNEIAQENIEKVFLLVEKMSPSALKAKEKNSENKKEITKKTEETKAASKTIKKELEVLNKDIKVCRAKIKKYNEEKRKNTPKKPKPTRHSKIKSHFVSIANLIPPTHKDNLNVQKEAKKVLLKAYREIMNTYKMNRIKTEVGEKALEELYDKIEEKLKK